MDDRQYQLSILTILLQREALENDRFFVRSGIGLTINLALMAAVITIDAKQGQPNWIYSSLLSLIGLFMAFGWYNLASFSIQTREFRERDCQLFIIRNGLRHVFLAELDQGLTVKPAISMEKEVPWKFPVFGNMGSSYVIYITWVFMIAWVALLCISLLGNAITITTAIPEGLRYYIDWEAMARDAEMSGDVLTVQTAHDEIHVFAGC